MEMHTNLLSTQNNILVSRLFSHNFKSLLPSVHGMSKSKPKFKLSHNEHARSMREHLGVSTAKRGRETGLEVEHTKVTQVGCRVLKVLPELICLTSLGLAITEEKKGHLLHQHDKYKKINQSQ